MEAIRFYAGQENGVIVEKDNFSQSVFYEKYQQAFSVFSRIWESENEDISNIIAICGDRGEGKTSFLKTIRNILADNTAYKKALASNIQISEDFKPKKIYALDVIDPAFFDAKHNLIELLLGKMYGKLRDRIKADENSLVSFDKTKLLQQFDKVKTCLSIIRKQSNESVYDKLEELDQLAAGMQLKEELDNLFEGYCKFFGAERLIICIDDLDLNMSEGYRMAEEIRKYLCNHKQCIIIVALKVEQMSEVIASYLRENTNKDIIDKDSVYEMANHYITKLLPLGHRVWMPSGNEIAEREVIIIDRNEKLHKFDSVKEAVVQLIFQKTRYIFVNNRTVSPIVPTNMRNLRHLLGSLFDMPPAKDNENRDNVENKRVFKHYFFNKWIECLSEKDYVFVSNLVTINDYSAINKTIITHLAYKFPKEQVVKEGEKNTSDQTKNDIPADTLLRNILDFRNSMYNISIGDVFYVMQRLEQTPTDINTYNLIFFIRSFYAIKLYETYDIISLNEKHLFKTKDPKTPSIYKYDQGLQKLNMMQRLINGSYFTYMSDELLPQENGNKSRDIRVLSGENIQDLFTALKEADKGRADDKEKEEYFRKLLNLCEFYALTLAFPVGKEGITESSVWRRSQEIVSLREPTTTNGYWIFDVMSIFYNVINYKMAYKRLSDNYFSDFYGLVEKENHSLLNQMIQECFKDDGKRGDGNLNKGIHGLISDAAIRSDTVLMAILDVAKNNRDKHKTGDNVENIKNLYNDIKKLEISLYSPDEMIDRNYSIPFNFLGPIIRFLNEDVEGEIKVEFEKAFATHIKRNKRAMEDGQQEIDFSESLSQEKKTKK